MKNTIMIDIETTGTRPGCKVLSIGAFGFSKNGEQVEFYKRFSLTEQIEAHLNDEDATLDWWKKQPSEVMMEAFCGHDAPSKAIGEFNEWVAQNFNTKPYTGFTAWCRGIDFDFPIIKAFFERFGYEMPWKFFTQRDYRTIAETFPKIKQSEGNIEKHNALEDAKAQMRGLRAFHNLYKNALEM